jgi:hypothetical protein
MKRLVNNCVLIFLPGMRVRAVVRVTESDAEVNPSAGPCEPGWVHCEPGDLGTVSYMGEFGPTVYFDRSGTGTLCDPLEVELVIPEAESARGIPFPQANTVSVVMDTVFYVSIDVNTAEALWPHLGMVKREAQYYADAAAYLGFLTKQGTRYGLTESGQHLVDADDSTTRGLLLAGMSCAPGVRLGITYVRKHGELPALSLVEQWVKRCGDVGGTTLGRRAGSLVAWLTWALDGCVDEADCYAP